MGTRIVGDVSKDISVSDDVYEALKRRKRGRSFSETIEEAIEQSSGLSDLVGKGAFTEIGVAEAKQEVQDQTRGTLKRLEDETADGAD